MLLCFNLVKTFYSRGVKDMTWKYLYFYFLDKALALKKCNYMKTEN